MRMKPWKALGRAPWAFVVSRTPFTALGFLAVSAMLGLLLLPLTVITVLLVPVWALGLAALERRRITWLGFARPASNHARVGRAHRHQWLGIRLGEPATWREVLLLLADLLAGWLALAVLAAQGLALAGVVAWTTTAPLEPTGYRIAGDLVLHIGRIDWWQGAGLIAVALVVFGYLNAVLALAQGELIAVLLAPRRAELEAGVAKLTASRASLVRAFEKERRDIERALHDGAQQELVALGMGLGLLELELEELRLAGHPVEEALAALAVAHDRAERALGVLRDSVRGIHPPVLVDHGLGAAVRELAGRAALPVRLVDDLGFRHGPEPEACAYFMVCEAITNALRHAAATELRVRVWDGPGQLRVTVSDNGAGGADPDRGSGLAGLLERARMLGGGLDINSPVGGPTRLELRLPSAAGLPDAGVPGGRSAHAHHPG